MSAEQANHLDTGQLRSLLSPVDPSQLDRAIAGIEKLYGEGRVRKGDDDVPVTRLSTGSLELDYATGGGIPMGRCSHFWGGYSAGKTLTCWHAVRSAQQLGMGCSYYNIEKQYDEAYVGSMGVDTSKLNVVDATTIEEVGTIVEATLGSVHLHVLDSLAAAVSVDELGARLEDWQIGLAARAWGKVLRRVNDRMDPNENAVIMVNHARARMDRSGEGAPGGKFIEHQSSCTVHFRRGGWLFYDANGFLSPDNRGGSTPTLSGDAEADGYEIIARVEKSRVGRPLRVARMRYDFAKRSIEHGFELAKCAKHFGVITETSAGRFELADGTKLHGIKRLREAIESDQTLQDLIRTTVVQAS